MENNSVQKEKQSHLTNQKVERAEIVTLNSYKTKGVEKA